MRHFYLAGVMVCLYAATADAQTKVTGTAQCGKADPAYALAVGDRADHNLALSQSKCTWTKPMEIGGDKSKDGVSTATADVSGDTARTRGFHIATMESGDKFFAWYQGTATTKDGAAAGQKGKWGFTGGTGKLKGIKGEGTFECTPSGDGGIACEVEGTYTLAK
jgi:hypothetical protein